MFSHDERNSPGPFVRNWERLYDDCAETNVYQDRDELAFEDEDLVSERRRYFGDR